MSRSSSHSRGAGALDAKGHVTDPITGFVPHEEPDARLIARFNVVKTIDDAQLSLALDHVTAGAGGATRESGGATEISCRIRRRRSPSNCFAPLLGTPGLVVEAHVLNEPWLEAILTIGKRSGRPNLDLLDPAANPILAVESKCTEYLKTRKTVRRSDLRLA